MKKIQLCFLLICLFSIGCSAAPKNNPYEINLSNFEVKNVNGKDVLYLKPNTIKYNDTYTHNVKKREIVKVNVYDLNADSIQYAINGPLCKKSFATVYIPFYITVTNAITDNYLASTTSGSNIKQLYIALKNHNNDKAKNITKNIFNDANSNICNYLLYGKDSRGKNVGYVYNKGYENVGIVFYYPDDFSPVLKNMWKGALDLGWKNTINNFIDIMEDYNPHIKIKIKKKKYDTYLLLTYK